MIGDVRSEASIFGEVLVGITIEGYVHSHSVFSDVSLGKLVITHQDLPDYIGDYTITPAINEQTFETEEKTLRHNIVINPIPYSEIDNEFGGKTVIIAAQT